MTREAVGSLETLTEHLPGKVKAEAEISSDWPLNIGKSDAEWAERELQKLDLGAKIPRAINRSMRTTLRNPWSRLAMQALIACAENKRVVPALKALAAGARHERKMIPLSRQTKAWATFYYLGNGDVVVIADWQNKSARLSGPITKKNVKDWWEVVEWCVLHHWQNPSGNYSEVLQLIVDVDKANPQSDDYYKQNKEYRKRSRALDRVKQAFESLVGVRCST
jgi:hypothetical protein